MLDSLSIRQKLGLLLVLPLFAVVATIVPFTVERVDDARAAAVTSRLARLAGEVGGLVQDLQQERVVALAYLVLPSTDRGALITQQRVVDDTVASLRGGGGGGHGHAKVGAGADPELALALDRVAGLSAQRRLVLSRGSGTAAVYRVYRDVIQALLDALHLQTRRGVDTAGLRQLTTLDALLRANQAATDVAAGLLIAAADHDTGAPLLAAAIAAEQQQRDRFRHLATEQQVALLDIVEQGPSGQRIAAITSRPSVTGDVATALGLANTYGLLRQTVEGRIATDVAGAAEGRKADARTAALSVGFGAALMLVLVVVLSLRVSLSIAAPLRRLSRAAAAVADVARAELVRVDDADETVVRPTLLAAVTIRGQHEIGELAAAINRVQATAALLLERQASARRNTAVMFANIARRTQSLASRQLSLIDHMERDEQDMRLLERLYRLDHLTTRLRRSADSLLVVSGNRDKELIAPTPLVTVVRAAAAEIEGFQAVRLGQVCDVVIAADLVADLRLLLAELLENATAFSPPGSFVEVGAESAGECRITVVDHGIGMPPARLLQENRRLVERPRLDVAPTEVLGLFVVGRLARRHGLTVRLDPTPGRGVTATVVIPPALWSAARPAAADRSQSAGPLPAPTDWPPTVQPRPAADRPQSAVRSLPVASADGPFAWFPALPGHGRVNGHGRSALADRPAAPDPTRSGLNQRVPGRFAPAFESRPAPPTPPAPRDAGAEAAQLTAFAEGAAQAAAEAAEGAAPAAAESGTGRHGLTRRTPGAHLAAAARPNPPAGSPGARPASAGPPLPRHRDPASERAALDGFVDGFARAARSLDALNPHDRKRPR